MPMPDDSPLIAAMRRPTKRMPAMAAPSMLEADLADLPGVQVGGPVSLSVQGIVKAMDGGRVTIEVQQVMPDQPEAASPQTVMTQESHVP